MSKNKLQLNKDNPNNNASKLSKPLYNHPGALKSGALPEQGHWPSIGNDGMWLKSMDHPTAWKEYMYYSMNPELNRAVTPVVNPEGYFGNRQLQYVPKHTFGGPPIHHGAHYRNGGEDKAPKSHYKRLYGHGKDYSVGQQNEYSEDPGFRPMKIDPETGYGYFDPNHEMSNQEQVVPESSWNLSRFAFQPFMLGEKQIIHNAVYDEEGNFIGTRELAPKARTLRQSMRKGQRLAKEDLEKYYEQDLGMSKKETREEVKDDMRKLRQMKSAQNKMGDHLFTEFQNPDNIFNDAYGTGYQMDKDSLYYQKPLTPRQAEKAYTKFQQAWRDVDKKEAKAISRKERDEAAQRNIDYILEKRAWDKERRSQPSGLTMKLPSGASTGTGNMKELREAEEARLSGYVPGRDAPDGMQQGGLVLRFGGAQKAWENLIAQGKAVRTADGGYTWAKQEPESFVMNLNDDAIEHYKNLGYKVEYLDGGNIPEYEEGGIITEYGWDYKKEGDNYLTKKVGSDKWITTQPGTKAYNSIKTNVFGEDPIPSPVPAGSTEQGQQSNYTGAPIAPSNTYNPDQESSSAPDIVTDIAAKNFTDLIYTGDRLNELKAKANERHRTSGGVQRDQQGNIKRNDKNEPLYNKPQCLAGALDCHKDVSTEMLGTGLDLRQTLYDKVGFSPEGKYQIPSGDIWGKAPNSSIDSWEFAQAIEGEGLGKVIYDNTTTKDKLTWDNDTYPSDLDYKNVPIGAIILQLYKTGSGYTDDSNLSNHAATVEGFTEDGIPLVYDYGNIVPITQTKQRIHKIVVPNGYENYTYDKMKKAHDEREKALGYEGAAPRNYDSDNENVNKVFQATDEIASQVGHDYSIPKKTMDKLQKRLVGIMGNESEFGENWQMPIEQIPGTNTIGKTVAKTYSDAWTALTDEIPSLFDKREEKADWEVEMEAFDKAGGDAEKAKVLYKDLRKQYAKPYGYSSAEHSVGDFQIKYMPKYAEEKLGINKEDLYGLTAEQKVEKGAQAALVHMLDSYKKFRKLYKDLKLSDDQLIDLATVAYNNQGKTLSPEYVQFYIKNGKMSDRYLADAKANEKVFNTPSTMSLDRQSPLPIAQATRSTMPVGNTRNRETLLTRSGFNTVQTFFKKGGEVKAEDIFLEYVLKKRNR